MTDEQPSTTPEPPAVATAEPVSLPSWMRESDTSQELTPAERRRLTWARHRGKVLVGLVAVVALALVVLLGLGGHTLVEGVRTATPPSPSPVPPNTIGEPQDHFADTPAADFPVGAEGIVLPPALATGPFSAGQVRSTLDGVRRALIEARLETAMLVGDNEPFLALLAKDARAGLLPQFADSTFLNYATRVDSRTDWEPDVRVSGTISYRATKDADGIRILEVTARFAWVYAFDMYLGKAVPPGAHLVVIRDTQVWALPHPDDVRASARGLWLDSAEATTWNADCSKTKNGFIALDPWFPGKGRRGSDPSPGLAEVFDPERPSRATESC
ncbi:hypothetical protein [Micromonospora sp. 4G55]|uniref:hypothetical protein n=1 Tax=Micromonospora sp. 4G55 TaxID=2806102 RepID=UPI001A5BAE9E|nr:hypothetical protein [Micromonospora sp. 4G55]MBM0259131.1 hypothetical protein [Micromonospora sp. 4G55]